MKFEKGEITKLCEVVVDLKLYSNLNALDMSWKLVTYSFLNNELIPNFSSKVEATYFLYSIHQELLGPLMKTLGFDFYHRVEPGSSLFIELYNEGNNNRSIDIYYMKDHKTKQYNKKTVTLEKFQEHLQETFKDFNEIFGPKEIEEICEVPYDQYLNDEVKSGKMVRLMEADDFLRALSKEYNIGYIYKDFIREYNRIKMANNDEKSDKDDL